MFPAFGNTRPSGRSNCRMGLSQEALKGGAVLTDTLTNHNKGVNALLTRRACNIARRSASPTSAYTTRCLAGHLHRILFGFAVLIQGSLQAKYRTQIVPSSRLAQAIFGPSGSAVINRSASWRSTAKLCAPPSQ
jgi:hypothetical protein